MKPPPTIPNLPSSKAQGRGGSRSYKNRVDAGQAAGMAVEMVEINFDLQRGRALRPARCPDQREAAPDFASAESTSRI
jgi:hypothetical protein